MKTVPEMKYAGCEALINTGMRRKSVSLIPGIATVNPGFDVTPARLITGFITDRGVFVPKT